MLYGKEHVQRYQETDGAEGHDWNNTTTLLLTTKGRKSGKSYTTPLIYQKHGDVYVVVASKGGDPDHPEWYKNLQANPEVEVQVKDKKFKARARTATDEERPELWRLMAATWPDYDNYQQKTDRKIPIVVLEPITG
ncbi:nitroreductase family deazaflavin-dependent oxidoreductase [Nonomuraea aurantiaca]|jgi:deazaflavin-dependent oxidoreductase (nitroreductase family)|uniref:nitroreductase family deazaflavin-dependent oxidoreductase n=1 Tax=Nonomuraea aurantiaca TaxID=2878562 RepID=UPI001CD952B4|nr:nitroreductase family deazaflavin-dependent oxidoreductase [Nonomuraea aurantiaca]MCA2228326.1 nitroreductase family deazaflavin-dependent oxidoreductase [Nonomuraea aurantiaca]